MKYFYKLQMKTTNIILRLTYFLFSGIILFFIYTMFTMVAPYFPYTYGHAFLSTKPSTLLNSTFYLISFYIHITTSFISLTTGLFQFLPFIIKKYPRLHRRLGMAYVYSILLLACPSGLVLAINANGGLSSKVGFTIQCFVWFAFTLLAVRAAVLKNWQKHVQLMLLSYAVTLAAFSLRTESYFMHLFYKTNPIETYQTVTWLSWVGNILIALLLIEMGLHKRILRALED
jgi:Predicted membrane protein (DUF2306)